MKSPSRQIGEPTPGYYLLKLVPRAWAVPSRIICEDGRYSAWIDGAPVEGSWTAEEVMSLITEWLKAADNDYPLVAVMMRGILTDQAIYEHRLAMKAWARQHAPSHPCLHPRKAIDSRLMPATSF